jgi:hypothetical protein
MHIKTKLIVSMALPLLLLSLISCDDPSSSFENTCVFKKTVPKKTAVVGEEVEVKLLLKSKKHEVKTFELQKQPDQKDFFVIGENLFEGGAVGPYQDKSMSYKILPRSPGKKVIGPSRITRVLTWEMKEEYILPSKSGFSNSVKIEVKPIELEVSLLFSKNEVLHGDTLTFDVLIENKSVVDIEGLDLIFDGNPEFVQRLKPKKKQDQFSIPAGQSRRLPFGYSAVTVKKAELGRCFIKKFKSSGHWFDLDKSYCSEPAPKIEVIPITFEVSQEFKKTKMRLGTEFSFDVIVHNKSRIEIRDVGVEFDGDLSNPEKIRLKRHTKFLSIPWGQTRRITFKCKAMQAGPILPGKAVIKSVQVGDLWLHLEKGYDLEYGYARSKPGPFIEITPVRLPGFRNPLTYVTKDFEQYFDNFLLKSNGITVGILVLAFLFRLVIRSRFSEYLAVKIVLNFLMGATAAVILVFLIAGSLWFLRILIPPVWKLAALLSCSCFIAFSTGLIPIKNILLGSVISGSFIAVVSYILFTGMKTFQLQNYSSFPISLTLFLVFAFGFGLNAWVFRKV